MCAHMAWHVCALNVNRLFELSGNRCNLLLVQSRGLASHWCSLNVFEGARLGWRLGEFNVIYVCLWVYLCALICSPCLQPFFVLEWSPDSPLPFRPLRSALALALGL